MSLAKEVAELKSHYEDFLVAYAGFSGGTKARATDARKALKEIADMCKTVRKSISDEKEKMSKRGGRKRGGADEDDG